MIAFLSATLTYLRAFLVSRHNLGLEAAALRQQLTVYKRKQPRPKLHRFDRLFWIALRRLWTDWADALVLVKPDTVVSWHRAGFRLFWRWRSRARRAGRPKVAQEVRESIRRKSRKSNLGCTSHSRRVASARIRDLWTHRVALSARTKAVSSGEQSQTVARLPDNHREVIAAFDFFTVPTLSFRTLYCFLVIEHGKRRTRAHLSSAPRVGGLHPRYSWSESA